MGRRDVAIILAPALLALVCIFALMYTSSSWHLLTGLGAAGGLITSLVAGSRLTRKANARAYQRGRHDYKQDIVRKLGNKSAAD